MKLDLIIVSNARNIISKRAIYKCKGCCDNTLTLTAQHRQGNAEAIGKSSLANFFQIKTFKIENYTAIDNKSVVQGEIGFCNVVFLHS